MRTIKLICVFFVLLHSQNALAQNYNIFFMQSPCIKPHIKNKYLTCQNIYVKINNDYYIIPQNFNTDLASLPRFMWPFITPAYSKFMGPSILHDYFYSNPHSFKRKDVDDIFYSALVNEKVNKTFAYIMYIGVRMVGWRYFDKKNREYVPLIMLKYKK